MALYLAHYSSLDSDANRARGAFEFESASRMGTKANLHDARIRMLEDFGNEALSWKIDKVERKVKDIQDGGVADGQLELDFRGEKKRRSRPKREEW